MASTERVARAIRRMGAATGRAFFGPSDEAAVIDAFETGLRGYSDGAVDAAAAEWSSSMPKFPTLVDFKQLCWAKDQEIDARALPEGGMMPRREETKDCAHCDHGWQSEFSFEQGRQVERLRKCGVCGGPKPLREKPAAKAEAKK